MSEHHCRACHCHSGRLVLDLGEQPASDHFPRQADPGPDPAYPLQMWLCSSCGLAQLLTDPTTPEEPRGIEPAALVAQAADAVDRVSAAGLLPPGARVTEYGSPHGGSWQPHLTERGLTPAADAQADIILDCFGLMHEADQAAAMAERAARLAPGGTLFVQYHALGTILRLGQWNALRHGHYAYYSATALTAMLAAVGLTPRQAWHFDLYGGTVLLSAGRGGDPDDSVRSLLAAEETSGILDPASLGALQGQVLASGKRLREWLAAMRESGTLVLGYGAASRAVAQLCAAGIDADLLAAVADASPAKQGMRMPRTRIPIISPADLTARKPQAVVVFVPDLLAEVRAANPDIEAHGGRWVTVDAS